ncbi:MAG: bifunctional phosphoribosylaminoimidazolecarboxamide formyltransferase/IMP cyclohydrolase [Elusimicrobiota bacterium]
MDKKFALISVSDKTGVVAFAKELTALGYNIISTGGTAKELAANSVAVTKIDDVTGFPEILDGRVKTLNPRIFGGILAKRNDKHLAELAKHKIALIDVVVCNLYPFEKTVSKLGVSEADAVENIDIGGVTLLRAAAKNFESVTIVCDAGDYIETSELLKSGKLDREYRKKLAAKAFRHTAYYDSVISSYFTENNVIPSEIAIGIKRQAKLRYGENPHQEGALYKISAGVGLMSNGVADAVQLQGKELSFNNYLDLEASWSIVNEYEEPACVIVKHNNPCGVAVAKSLKSAYLSALLCDPVSAFGGILGFNREVDAATAEEIIKIFVECVIAPKIDGAAKTVFAKKKNLRVLELALPKKDVHKLIDYRLISGGMLVQGKDTLIGLDDLKVVTKRQPTKEELDSLKFAWVVSKNVKSNAIILSMGTQTIGIGAGQMSRIDSLNIAVSKMSQIDKMSVQYPVSQPVVLASDAFFPFDDVVRAGAKSGVKAIIQPGGSINDKLSIDACDELGIAMVFTGIRHFRH